MAFRRLPLRLCLYSRLLSSRRTNPLNPSLSASAISLAAFATSSSLPVSYSRRKILRIVVFVVFVFVVFASSSSPDLGLSYVSRPRSVSPEFLYFPRRFAPFFSIVSIPFPILSPSLPRRFYCPPSVIVSARFSKALPAFRRVPSSRPQFVGRPNGYPVDGRQRGKRVARETLDALFQRFVFFFFFFCFRCVCAFFFFCCSSSSSFPFWERR